MLAQVNWWQQIDSYCERNDPSFWAEPLNAWSNAAFWLAAVIFAVWLRRALPTKADDDLPQATLSRARLRELWLLNLLLIGIGIGSFCFHTYAVRWAAMLDVAFIVLWVYAYLWISARRVLLWPLIVILPAMILHLGLAIVLLVMTGWFLLSYLPTAVAAYLLALHASGGHRPGERWLWASAIVFTFSMVMAGLDEPLCQWVPTGTHFLWHVFNAAALLSGSIGLARNLMLPVASTAERDWR